jgi:hypothetical protein
MRPICRSSVRWPVSKYTALPSVDHETVLANEFARKLTGRDAAPSAETTFTLVNILAPADR